ncbi:MAG: FTR1 family protein [Coxiellaceae bacterium]|nr:FTR1 family protein [Coxiellaceae bacterium]
MRLANSQSINPFSRRSALVTMALLFAMLPKAFANGDGAGSSDALITTDETSIVTRELFELGIVVSTFILAIARLQRQNQAGAQQDGERELRLSTEQANRFRWMVTASVVAGVIAAGVLCGPLVYAYHEHGKEGIGDTGVKLIEGITKFAIGVLVHNFGIEILKLLSPVRSCDKAEGAITKAASADSRLSEAWAVGKYPFMTALGEVSEAILVLGLNNQNAKSLALSIPVGVAISSIAVLSLHFSSRLLSRDKFRKAAAVLLAAISSGMFNYAAHEFQELKVFGPYGDDANVPWYNVKLWETSLSHKKNEFGKFLRTFIGYDSKPTALSEAARFLALGLFAVSAYKFLRKEKNQIAMARDDAQVKTSQDLTHWLGANGMSPSETQRLLRHQAVTAQAGALPAVAPDVEEGKEDQPVAATLRS